MIFFSKKFLKPVCLILGGKNIKTLVAMIQQHPLRKMGLGRIECLAVVHGASILSC